MAVLRVWDNDCIEHPPFATFNRWLLSTGPVRLPPPRGVESVCGRDGRYLPDLDIPRAGIRARRPAVEITLVEHLVAEIEDVDGGAISILVDEQLS